MGLPAYGFVSGKCSGLGTGIAENGMNAVGMATLQIERSVAGDGWIGVGRRLLIWRRVGPLGRRVGVGLLLAPIRRCPLRRSSVDLLLMGGLRGGKMGGKVQ